MILVCLLRSALNKPLSIIFPPDLNLCPVVVAKSRLIIILQEPNKSGCLSILHGYSETCEHSLFSSLDNYCSTLSPIFYDRYDKKAQITSQYTIIARVPLI